MTQYRHKKTKDIHTLVRTNTTPGDQGFKYFHMERDGKTMIYGKTAFENTFEPIEKEIV